MKALKLTKQHKSKLLEMCKILFPEYFYWDLNYHIISAYINGNDNEIYEDEDYDLAIHWFEFCMLNLAPKILPIFTDMKNFYAGLNESNEDKSFNKHPIDYLYKEFKKLKL